MKTIGLVGGVASGKSRVAQIMVDLGAGLLDADRAGHAVLADQGVRQALRQRWGPEVFLDDGSVDRAAVARRVFAPGAAPERERRFLESVTHPRIAARLESQRDHFAESGYRVVVLDAALLFEANWNPMCDLVVFVDAPREVRLHRARQRGWTDEEFLRREAAQWPVKRKRGQADVIIDNGGTPEELQQAVRKFWDQHVAP
jgi:dephospho-CoA kinase